LIGALSGLYGAAAAWRRRWYAPSRQRRLSRPVISVGNLRVGGSGKTPIVEHLARLLIDAGERPAILTRGYARRAPQDGATVVSNGARILAPLDSAGDEPLMLARAVPGAIVVVGADRHLSGLVAERKLGATVHLLDDGFQHFELARDVDLLLASDEDLTDRPLPSGRLRERLEAAKQADAVLANATYQAAADRIARALGLETAFRVTRTIGAPRLITGDRDTVVVPPESRVFLVTGIARPERFEADIAAAGWHVAGALVFRDHHSFDARDIKRITSTARGARCAIVLTTEKDAVRLGACDLGDLPIASVPLLVGVEPEDAFRAWLLARIGAASTEHPAPSTQHPSA
jgi:tetraacyldisaccharide 4'-kinase